MNKGDLVSKIAADADITKVAAAKALESFVDAVTSTLKSKDGKVSLIGFGTFSVNAKAARTGRNPATAKEIQIAAKNSVKFKAGKELSEGIN